MSELLVEIDDPRRLTLLREKNPDYIRALNGTGGDDHSGAHRRWQDRTPGRERSSVSITEAGDLHMRYTVRVNNVIWVDDAVTREALAFLSETLGSDSPYIYRGLLMPGMGLISNNVLHDRAAFTDDATHQRDYTGRAISTG